MRVLLDTNIIVSGLLFGGVPFQILEHSLKKRFDLITSPPLITETERVLSYKKFGLNREEVFELISPIWDVAEIIVPAIELDVIKTCPADNRVLECALIGRCDYIITGDKRDILHLKYFRGIDIVTARAFLDIL